MATEDLEQAVRAHCDAGELKPAATRAVEGYGPEIYGFLTAALRSEEDAAEVFSAFCEDLWRGLPEFGWRASLRTWLYRLARSAMARHLRAPERRRPMVPLSQVSELAERVRTQTARQLRTEAKDALARIRESLDPEDRMLLVLRVDRRLPWDEVAFIMGEPAGEAEAIREAARLRKRFQVLKEEIRARMAEEEAPER